MAFRLHLLERVAVETGGTLGNERHGAERPAASGTESSRGKGSSRTEGLDLGRELDTGSSA